MLISKYSTPLLFSLLFFSISFLSHTQFTLLLSITRLLKNSRYAKKKNHTGHQSFLYCESRLEMPKMRLAEHKTPNDIFTSFLIHRERELFTSRFCRKKHVLCFCGVGWLWQITEACSYIVSGALRHFLWKMWQYDTQNQNWIINNRMQYFRSIA